MLKKYCIISLAIIIPLFLSGCYDSREVDDMAYAMAIGIDKGKTHELKLTLQFASPKSEGDNSGEKKGSGEGVVFTTVEAPTIFSGLNMINNYISKQVNMSHAKLIVFSKEVAEQGIYKYINSVLRAREFRGNMFVAVSRSSAEEFVKSTTPKMQSNSARLFEGFFKTYQFTAFSANTQLIDVYKSQQSSSSQAVAALVGLGKYENSSEFDTANSTFAEKGDIQPLEGDYKAGDLPKIFDTKTEVMGLAVFDGSRMVGELDGEQSSMYLISTGKYNYSYISIPDPYNPNDFVVLSVKNSRKPVHKMNISGEKPVIKSDIRLEADIVAIQSGYNYENPDLTAQLEDTAEKHIKDMMVKFLYKTSRDFNSDICGFGKHAKMKFLTWSQWSDYNWLKRYRDATFEVDVDLKIRRPGLVVRTVPSKNTKGEDVK